MNRWTKLVNFNPCPEDPYHANNTPIYQTATFAQESALSFGKYDYTRSGNPTRSVLETQLAQLEQAQHAFAFNSGMAALAALVSLVKPGEHIIAGNDLYGGTYRLLTHYRSTRNIQVSFVDTTVLTQVAQALIPNTRLILVETPSNPLQKISDIRALAKLAHANQAWLAIDNTTMSPWLQQPLTLGADIVIHSATKHLAGHGDLMAGVLMANCDQIAKNLAFTQNAEGTALAPFDSWLLLRSIKTLGLRVERQQENAVKIAQFLQQHHLVKKVYYPGLSTHPGYNIHQQQATGNGTVISFETGSSTLSQYVVEHAKLFTIAVSFGNLKSSISLPVAMSHAPIAKLKSSLAPPTDLVRLAIGIEHADDLVADLDKALHAAAAVTMPVTDNQTIADKVYI